MSINGHETMMVDGHVNSICLEALVEWYFKSAHLVQC